MHSTILPNWAQPSCDQIPALAFTYGGVAALTRFDTVFPAPMAVHWGLAGALANYQCKGVVVADRDMAMAAAMGYVGGMAGRIIPFALFG